MASDDPRPDELVKDIEEHKADVDLFGKKMVKEMRMGNIDRAKYFRDVLLALTKSLHGLYEEGVRYILPGYKSRK